MMSGSGSADTQHSYYERVPIIRRPALRWPGNARLAFAIVISAEYYELQPPKDAFIPPNVPGGFGRGPYPDFRAYSARAYGNRVGIFRLLELLDRLGLRATIAVDALTASSCRALVDHLRSGPWEIAAHGQSATRVVSSRMSADEERDYIRSAIAAVEEHCGVRPAGWHSPEYGESTRTVALLTELGMRYVLDWPNDEQPYAMTSAAGTIVSLPMAIDLDDVFSHYQRKIPMSRWCRCLVESVERLVRDGEDTGRVLILNLHPWLIGHPFRISYLEDTLGILAERKDMWFATAAEIAAWWRSSQI